MVMKNFEIQSKSMVDKSKQPKPDVAKMINNTTIAKWMTPSRFMQLKSLVPGRLYMNI